MKKYIKETKPIQLVILVTTILSNLLMVVNSYLSTWMTNAVINENIRLFIKLALLVVLVMALVPVFSYIKGKFISKSNKTIANKIREDYMANLISSYKPILDRKKMSSDIVSRMTNDVSFVIDKGLNVLYDLLNSSLGVILPLLGASFIHPIFLLVFPSSILFQNYAIKKISPKMQELSQDFSKQNQAFVGDVSDIFEGFDTYFRVGASKSFASKLKVVSQMLEDKKYAFNERQFFYNSLMMGLMIISQFFYIIVAGLLVATGRTSPGTIVGLMTLAQGFYANSQIAVNNYLTYKASEPILQTLTSITEDEKNDKKISIKDGIKISNLSYAYDEDNKIFSNLNLDFKMGKKYLLTGKSGAGKSTLLKIMAGYIEGYEGNIFYDNTNLRDVDFKELMENLAYIDQDVYIFNDSLKFNICLGKDINKDLYQKAIKLADLDEFISEKSDGDDFIINLGASNISGGQKQRIAIARAFVSGKKIFFIDEGLAGMDRETKNIVENNLLKENILLVMVSHVSDDNKDKYDEEIRIEWGCCKIMNYYRSIIGKLF